jgi:hypothetical protein
MSTPLEPHKIPKGVKAILAEFVWRITPKCREVARLTSQGRDRRLPLIMRARLLLHRTLCQWCARYARQLDLLHRASHALPEHMDIRAEPALDGYARERLKRALREHAN